MILSNVYFFKSKFKFFLKEFCLFCYIYIFMMDNQDSCLIDSAITHTILQDKKYFLDLILVENNVNMISGALNIVKGSERACIILLNNTKLYIDDTLYSNKSRRNLLSFKDIRCNEYHIETMQENNVEYLCITSFVSGKKQIKEKFHALPSSMYFIFIKMVESKNVTN